MISSIYPATQVIKAYSSQASRASLRKRNIVIPKKTALADIVTISSKARALIRKDLKPEITRLTHALNNSSAPKKTKPPLSVIL